MSQSLARLRRRIGYGLAAAALIPLSASVPSAAAASQAWQLNIAGRGYGHGIGMSQYGAYGLALHGSGYRDILKHYYSGIGFATRGNPGVRVLLASSQPSVAVTCRVAYQAVVGSQTVDLAAGSVSTVTWTGSAFKLASGSASWTTSRPVAFRPTSALLVLVNRSGILKVANASYRGSITVARQSSALCVINTLPLESYLRGVVPLEVPSRWPAEALKAQAVAARTYTVRSLTGRGLFDLYCDTRSQSYAGASHETAATDAAVAASKGVIATYDGQPIAAFYFSTSGGHTENIENVWDTGPQRYLKGVPDPYDSLSPYHVWPENPLRRSASSIATALGSSTPPGSLQVLYVTRRGVSRRVVQALAIGSAGARRLSGSAIRAALGLRATWFDVRTMSISPASRVVLAAGQRLAISGRTYPALATTTRVKLFYYRGGAWTSVSVPSSNVASGTRKVTAGGVTTTCSFTTYRYTIKPPATTKYYFATGSSRSPQITIAVQGSVTPSASPSVGPSPTGGPSPAPSASPTAEPPQPVRHSYSSEALRRFRIRRWGEAALRWRVVCKAAAPDARARVVIRVRRVADGRSVKTIVLDGRRLNTVSYTRFRCGLRRGSYRYYIYASFPNAAEQVRVGMNRFVVW